MGANVNTAATAGTSSPGGGGGSLLRANSEEQDDGEGQGFNAEDYKRLYVLSAREGNDGFSLVDWFSLGLSKADVDAELKGDGTFGYALIGTELSKSDENVTGLLFGIENSSWTYENESDVTKTGFSFGYYGANRVNGLLLTGSAIMTLASNDFVSNTGATADASSRRIMLTGQISGQHDSTGGASISPYVSLLYASESTSAFVFSDGVPSEKGTSRIGKVSVGLEYAAAVDPRRGQFIVRGELGQTFGADDIVLNDGSVYTPNKDVVGSLTLGWISNPGTDSKARIELTFGELGNDENGEISLDGTWDRHF
jgi:hypothetical protein